MGLKNEWDIGSCLKCQLPNFNMKDSRIRIKVNIPLETRASVEENKDE